MGEIINNSKAFVTRDKIELANAYLSDDLYSDLVEASLQNKQIIHIANNLIAMASPYLVFEEECLYEYIIRSALKSFKIAKSNDDAFRFYLEQIFYHLPMLLDYTMKGKRSKYELEYWNCIKIPMKDWLSQMKCRKLDLIYHPIESKVSHAARSWMVASHIFSPSELEILELPLNSKLFEYNGTISKQDRDSINNPSLHAWIHSESEFNSRVKAISSNLIALTGRITRNDNIKLSDHILNSAVEAYKSTMTTLSSHEAMSEFVKTIFDNLPCLFDYKVQAGKSTWHCLDGYLNSWLDHSEEESANIYFCPRTNLRMDSARAWMLARYIFDRKDLEHLDLPSEGRFKTAFNGFTYLVG